MEQKYMPGKPRDNKLNSNLKLFVEPVMIYCKFAFHCLMPPAALHWV